MPRIERYMALIIILVLLSGCMGYFTGESVPRSTSTPIESDTLPAEQTQPITVTNNRSVPYTVTFRVVRGPIRAVNLTYANGSVRKKRFKNPQLPDLPFLSYQNITGVDPVNTTAVAQWSAIVQPESTVTLPIPSERQNMTLLVVVKTKTAEQSQVIGAPILRCSDELGGIDITVQEPEHFFGYQWGCA